jgi:hypothetical protein
MIRPLIFIAALSLMAGCATRSVPHEIASDAPSSPKADEAPLVSVIRSLEQEPPFDATSTATTSPHHHHGGHHHGN